MNPLKDNKAVRVSYLNKRDESPRKYVPKSDEATARRHKACKENYSLFMLKGMLNNAHRLEISTFNKDLLVRTINLTIDHIKDTQASRKLAAKKGKPE